MTIEITLKKLRKLSPTKINLLINFIKSCSLSHTPGYSWGAMLRFTYVHLKIITDIEKNQFIETTIKCVIPMIFKGYAEARNKFLKSYDAIKPALYIIYLNVHNLYGHSMMQLLPTEILGCVNPKDFNLDSYFNDSPIGCVLEVDDSKMYDLHNDYPLREKTKVTDKTFSKYKLQIIEDNNSFSVNSKILFLIYAVKEKINSTIKI